MSKSKHGGGGRSHYISPPIQHGNPNTKTHTPDAAASIGRMVGNHATDPGRNITQRPNSPLAVEKKDFVPMGNEVALNVGRGGPGAGRVVHRSGSQGLHGPVRGGEAPAQRRDILSEFGPDVPGRKR